MVLANHEAVTPAGRPVGVPIPVATVVVYVIAATKAVLIQIVGLTEGNETVLSTFTIIVPVAFTVPQPPVNGIVYANVPEADGVPLIVMVFAAQTAVTPVGKP